MSDNQDRINLLHQKLDFLIKRQDSFQKEISDLKKEIELLQPETFSAPKVERVSYTEENQFLKSQEYSRISVLFQNLLPQDRSQKSKNHPTGKNLLART